MLQDNQSLLSNFNLTKIIFLPCSNGLDVLKSFAVASWCVLQDYQYLIVSPCNAYFLLAQLITISVLLNLTYHDAG